MKHVFIFAFGLVFSSVVCAEGVSVSDVEVRQLWPWSGDIDIGFTITGGNTAVKFTAQYDGVEPFEIPERELSGDFFDAAPGRRHVRWNLKRAGLDGKTLFNLKITAQADATDRTYLILNLVDGSYRYAATEPEGGWMSFDKGYGQTNMVFRRVPAGTFTMGYSQDILDKFFVSYTGAMGARPMTLSSDFYMAVYKASYAQHLYVTNKIYGTGKDILSSSYSSTSRVISYNQMRGSVDEDGINWPHTGYDVAPGSVIAAYRKITKNTLPPDWTIDLPTSAQWARAARAKTPDGKVWDIRGKYFGDVDTSMTDMTNYANQVGYWKGGWGEEKRTLGKLAPNGWGFYDFNGSAFEWALDWYGWYGTTIDPVGPNSSSSGRMRCGSYGAGTHIEWMFPGFLYYYSPSTVTPGYRLCIHLKSLFKGK